jgi:hypothetical protein
MTGRPWPVAVAVAVALALAGPSSACIIEPNPDFMGAEAETGTGAEAGSDRECLPGTLDCDAFPGCEARSDDPLSCGSCTKRCEFDGELLECVAGRCEGTVILTNLADAYVDRDAPQQNFGAEPVLRVDSRREAYIKLPDLAGLPSAAYEDISLSLPCSSAGGAVQLLRLEASWDEGTISWDTAPGVVGSTLASFEPKLGANVIDLNSLLPGWREGSPKHSLALRSQVEVSATQAGVVFVSRESGAGPVLTMTLSW